MKKRIMVFGVLFSMILHLVIPVYASEGEVSAVIPEEVVAEVGEQDILQIAEAESSTVIPDSSDQADPVIDVDMTIDDTNEQWPADEDLYYVNEEEDLDQEPEILVDKEQQSADEWKDSDYLIGMETDEEKIDMWLSEAAGQIHFDEAADDYCKVQVIYQYICLAGLDANDRELAEFSYRLFELYGIPACAISGTDGNGETVFWNLVRVGELFYNTDASADIGKMESYACFLKGAAAFGEYARDPEYISPVFAEMYPVGAEDYQVTAEVVDQAEQPEEAEIIKNPDIDTDQDVLSSDESDDTEKTVEENTAEIVLPDVVNTDQEDGETTEEQDATETNIQTDNNDEDIQEEPSDIAENEGKSNTASESLKSEEKHDHIEKEADRQSETEDSEEADEAEFEEELLSASSGNWEYTIKSNGTIRIDRYVGKKTTVSIPSTIAGKKVTEIGYEAFDDRIWNEDKWEYDHFITKVTIPNTVQTIGNYAFSGCSKLVSVNIPDSVTEIGWDAFSNCTSLKKIAIPASVTALDSTFEGCSNLTSVSLPSTVTSISGAFSRCTSLKTITIPDSVTDMNNAFSGCTSLTSVRLPNDLTRISYGAFSGCTALKTITLPSGVIRIESSAFSGCTGLRSINLQNIQSIEYSAFESCINLTKVELDQEKDEEYYWYSTSIGSGAFRNCISLKEVKLSPYTTSIGENAFYDCDHLASITIYASTTSVGQAAFRNCSLLKNVYYGGTSSDWSKITIGLYNDPLNRATKHYLGATKIDIPSSITAVPGEIVALSPQLSPYNTMDKVKDIEWDYNWSGLVSSIDDEGNVTLSTYNYETRSVTVTAKIRDVSAQCVITVCNNPILKYTAYQQNYGELWETGGGGIAGMTGLGLRLEALKIKINADDKGQEAFPGLGIEYRAHVQGIGWQDWKSNGELSGTTGQSKRLEAIQIRLTGENAKYYDICYRTHAQQLGWLSWARNGEPSGTSGYGYRLEAVLINIVPKGDQLPDYFNNTYDVTSNFPYIDKAAGPSIGTNSGLIAYNTHVQTYGWQEYKFDGDMAGTQGESKRLEGIHIQLQNQEYSGDIVYRTHVQTYGWQDWKKNGEMSGTSGESKRLEGIQIYLTGEMAKHYDVYYRVHAQTYGWLDYAKNGVMAGTSGLSKRLEGINIVLVPKGGDAPGATANPNVVGGGGNLPDNPYVG